MRPTRGSHATWGMVHQLAICDYGVVVEVGYEGGWMDTMSVAGSARGVQRPFPSSHKGAR